MFYRVAYAVSVCTNCMFDSISVIAAVEWSLVFDGIVRWICVGVSNELDSLTHTTMTSDQTSNGIKQASAGEAKLLFISIRAKSRSDPTQRAWT